MLVVFASKELRKSKSPNAPASGNSSGLYWLWFVRSNIQNFT
jgi:hypothetical protein